MLVTLLLGMAAGSSRASGPDVAALDAAALAQLEQRAEQADPREQCYLYAEVVQGFTDLAGRQMEAGEDEQAGTTLRHVDVIAAKLHNAMAKDAKRLKNAEQMLGRTTRHLSDMVRVASLDQRTNMQQTLQHLNMVHSELLATVFAK
jgi:hypothetical protein